MKPYAGLLNLFLFVPFFLAAQKTDLYYPALTNQFDSLKGNTNTWFTDQPQSILLRKELLNAADSAFANGLIRIKYHYSTLTGLLEKIPADSTAVRAADRLFTDAAIALCRDLLMGYRQEPWVNYDQLSKTNTAAVNNYLLLQLQNLKAATDLQNLVVLLEPADTVFRILKKEYRLQQEKKNVVKQQQLRLSMNYHRWIRHFPFEQYVVVNIPAARLQYFRGDSIVLEMKTVVGKPETPTPRFATWCEEVILYPYWYVPSSIIFNEYLPLIQQNPSWLDARDMQVVDKNGKVLNHHKLDWAAFGPGYFPYLIRQSTGCDNALGVIKFNIQTPYGVYMHDTNNHTAFLSGSRFYSHGCIRLEEPIELGNLLLTHQLDTNFLKSCFKDQQPVPVKMDKPVPVFVVYMPAMVNSAGKVVYYKDVYKLLR
jgi:L,D-transpeptidase YcbB